MTLNAIHPNLPSTQHLLHCWTLSSLSTKAGDTVTQQVGTDTLSVRRQWQLERQWQGCDTVTMQFYSVTECNTSSVLLVIFAVWGQVCTLVSFFGLHYRMIDCRARDGPGVLICGWHNCNRHYPVCSAAQDAWWFFSTYRPYTMIITSLRS
jgi:hypothetical protein